MKTANLRVGGKGVKPVTVPVSKAESIEDMSTLAKGDVAVITRCFNRGFSIECQERSGARDLVKELREKNTDDGEVEKQVAAVVAAYDPTKTAPRGGTRERKPIEIKAGANGKISMDDFRKQLEAAGVKLNFVSADNGASQPAAQ